MVSGMKFCVGTVAAAFGRSNRSPIAVPSLQRICRKRASSAGARQRPEEPGSSIPRRIGRILARTGRAFFDDNVARLGAALAFYTTVALAPLLVLAIRRGGIFFNETEAREKVPPKLCFSARSSPASRHSAKAAVTSPRWTQRKASPGGVARVAR
jgi:hypothetical protein